MKAKTQKLLLAVLLAGATHQLHAQGTAFTYQGQLLDGGSPATGNYDLKLTLFNAVTNGSSVAGPVTNTAVSVTNGLFTTTIDFGTAFDGNLYWLRIQVRTNGGSGFTLLSPRQQLTPSPYAVFATTASNLSGTVSFAQLPSGIVTNSETSLTLAGNFSGNGTGLTNVNAAALNGLTSGSFWQIGGNSVSGGQFLGSTNSQPVEIWANKQRAFRVEPDITGSGAPNVIGGSPNNFMTAGGVIGGFIGGGGAVNYNGAAYSNNVSAYFGTIGGGLGNVVQAYANGGFIGGGYGNNVQNSSTEAVIGGGGNNIAGGTFSFVGGGLTNNAQGNYSTIGGGQDNTGLGKANVIAGGLTNNTSGLATTVGGGQFNSATALSAVVAGGTLNTAASQYSAIGGGYDNSVSGQYGVIAGGNNNLASATSSAVGGGYNNTASGQNSTVGGGGGNIASGFNSTVGGGWINQANLDYATVGGGFGNISTNLYSTIAGGSLNQALGEYSVIAGGYQNSAKDYSFVGGGSGNAAGGSDSVVGGGLGNTAGGSDSVVGGGFGNTAGGSQAAVPGGSGNSASGSDSFAAGSGAQASYANSFVWSDGSWMQDTGSRQFLIRATGGVGINMNNPNGDALSIGGYLRLNDNIMWLRGFPDSKHGLVYAGNGFSYGGASPDGPVLFGYGGGALLATANNYIALQWTTTSVTVNGTFNNNSDRNAKEKFSNVSAADVLEKVSSLPLSEWSYKTDSATRHIGPMAQDFYAAFNVGTDEKHIAPIDESGVALAAIQGLNQKLREEVSSVRAENGELKARLEKLERLMTEKLGSAK